MHVISTKLAMIRFIGVSGAAAKAGALEHSASFDFCDDILDSTGKASAMGDYIKSLYCSRTRCKTVMAGLRTY
jgi:hypothetical protein